MRTLTETPLGRLLARLPALRRLAPLLAVVALGLVTAPSPGARAAPAALTLVVEDDNFAPVAGAEVYLNCVYRGDTSSSGGLTITGAAAGDTLDVRKNVFTGTTNKLSHSGWSYHVWVTNITQHNDGSQTDDVVVNPSSIQTVVIHKNDTEIGINLLASVEYHATPANLAAISRGLAASSAYLFDVTDGQMFFEQVNIMEDQQSWADADIQYFADRWPTSYVGALASSTGQMHLPGGGFEGAWDQTSGLRTAIHEFSHYAIGVYDEYFKLAGADMTDHVDSICTLDRAAQPEDVRASIMDQQRDSTEFCDDSDHNPNTAQGQILQQSAWATFRDNWAGPSWNLVTPMQRGTKDPGPTALTCMAGVLPVIHAVSGPSCDALPLYVQMQNAPFAGGQVTLYHGTQAIAEGASASNGHTLVYGAVPGDTVYVSGTVTDTGGLTPGTYFASVPITACTALTGTLVSFDAAVYYPIAAFNFDTSLLLFQIPVIGGAPSPIVVSYAQDNGRQHQVTMTYDPRTQQLNGSAPFDASQGYNLSMSMLAQNAQHAVDFGTFRYVGAKYHPSGPPRPVMPGRGSPHVVPVAWDLLPAGSPVNLSVNARSLLSGTGVLAGETRLPASPPAGFVPLAGPYSVKIASALTGTAGLTIRYDTHYPGGVQPGTIAIYRYAGSAGWTPLPSTLLHGHDSVAAAIAGSGVFAVFARPAAPCTDPFSDVPPSAYFYTPVLYLYCHSVISGYADGTFRPFANTTRSQQVKIVVLGFNKVIVTPPAGAYTFSDVPPSNPFFAVIETAAAGTIVSGYACGGPSEPCDSAHRPYFRPYANVTRGQLSKIDVVAAGWTLVTPPAGTFADVGAGSAFYSFVETAACHGIISGYVCGGSGEPCDSTHRPYFRQYTQATRGQIAKIVYLSITNGAACARPTATP